MTIRLDLDLAGGTFAYANVQFVDEQVATVVQLASDGRVEHEAIALTLLSPSLLGVTDLVQLAALADGSVRARLVNADTEAVLLDGVVRLESVAHGRAWDGGVRRWSLEVEDDALARVIERLDAVRLHTLRTIAAVDVLARVGTPETDPEILPAYRLIDLLAAAAADTETGDPVALTLPPGLFSTPVRYLDGAGDEQIHRSGFDAVVLDYEADRVADDGYTLPRQNAAEILDLVQLVSGARVVARYAPWPSRQLVAALVLPTLPEAAPPVAALDAVPEDYDVAYEEAEEPDLAITYEGSLAGVVGLDLTARYGAERWALRTTTNDQGEEEVEILNRSVVTIPARSPRIVDLEQESEQADAYAETVQVGAALIEEDGMYLMARYDARVLAYAEPADPAPSLPYPRYHPLWAGMILTRQTSRAAHLVATLSVSRTALAAASISLPVVGERVEASLLGVAWDARRMRVGLDDNQAEVQMARPARALVDLAVPRLLAPILRAYIRHEVVQPDPELPADHFFYAVALVEQVWGSQEPESTEVEYSEDEGATWDPYVDPIHVVGPDVVVQFRARNVSGGGAVTAWTYAATGAEAAYETTGAAYQSESGGGA